MDLITFSPPPTSGRKGMEAEDFTNSPKTHRSRPQGRKARPNAAFILLLSCFILTIQLATCSQQPEILVRGGEARTWYPNLTPHLHPERREALTWLEQYRKMLTKWTRPAETISKRLGIAAVEEESPESHKLGKEEERFPVSVTTRRTIRSTSSKTETFQDDAERRMMVDQATKSGAAVIEDVSSSLEKPEEESEDLTPMESRRITDEGISGQATSFLSSFFGSFLPGFDSKSTQRTPSVPVTATKSYAHVRRTNSPSENGVTPPHGGLKTRRHYYPLRANKKRVNQGNFGLRHASHANVRTGYAQVNRHQNNDHYDYKDESTTATTGQRQRVYYTSTERSGLLPPNTDLNSNIDAAASTEHTHAQESDAKLARDAHFDTSESPTLSTNEQTLGNDDIHDNERSTTFATDLTPDLQGFCRDSLAATLLMRREMARRRDPRMRSAPKTKLYKQLWELVDKYGIPVDKKSEVDESNQQMVILLEALCGEMEGNHEESSTQRDFEIPADQMTASTKSMRNRITPKPVSRSTLIDTLRRSSPAMVTSTTTRSELESVLESLTEDDDRFKSFVKKGTVEDLPRRPTFQMASGEPQEQLKRPENFADDREEVMVITLRPDNPLRMSTTFPFEPKNNVLNGGQNIVVSSGFSFGDREKKPNMKQAGKIMNEEKKRPLPPQRRRNGGHSRRRPPPPRSRNRNRLRNNPPPPQPNRRFGSNRRHDLPETFPFPPLQGSRNNFFPKGNRPEGGFPPSVRKNEQLEQQTSFFQSLLKPPSPPFTPRPLPKQRQRPQRKRNQNRRKQNQIATPPLVRRDYWPKRPGKPQHEFIPFDSYDPFQKRPVQNDVTTQIDRKPTSPPAITIESSEEIEEAEEEVKTTTNKPVTIRQAYTSALPPRRVYTHFEGNDAVSMKSTRGPTNYNAGTRVISQRPVSLNLDKDYYLDDIIGGGLAVTSGTRSVATTEEEDSSNDDATTGTISDGPSLTAITEKIVDIENKSEKKQNDLHLAYNVTFLSTPPGVRLPPSTTPMSSKDNKPHPDDAFGFDMTPGEDDLTALPTEESLEEYYDDEYYYYGGETTGQRDAVNKIPVITTPEVPRRATIITGKLPPVPRSTNPTTTVRGYEASTISTSTPVPSIFYFPDEKKAQNSIFADLETKRRQAIPVTRIPPSARPEIRIDEFSRPPDFNMSYGTRMPFLEGRFEKPKISSEEAISRKDTTQQELPFLTSSSKIKKSTQGPTAFSRAVPLRNKVAAGQEFTQFDSRAKLPGGNTYLLDPEPDYYDFTSEGGIYDPFQTSNRRRSTTPKSIEESTTSVLTTTTTTKSTATTTTTTSTTTTPEPEMEDTTEYYEYVYEYVDDNGNVIGESVINPSSAEMEAGKGDDLEVKSLETEVIQATEDEIEKAREAALDLITGPGNQSEEEEEYEYYYVETGEGGEYVEVEENEEEEKNLRDLLEKNEDELDNLIIRDQEDLLTSLKRSEEINLIEEEGLASQRNYFGAAENDVFGDERQQDGLRGEQLPSLPVDETTYYPPPNGPEFRKPSDFSTEDSVSAASGRNDRFAEAGLPSLESEESSSPSAVLRKAAAKEAAENEGMNPEKLAYILIGVCCGLSILCLIVVAISIGYKSETHYRLDEGRKKRHIRLLKASTNEEGRSSSGRSNFSETESQSEEFSSEGMRLGPWFNKKNHIHTIDRKSAGIAFPTSVYLENLDSGAEDESGGIGGVRGRKAIVGGSDAPESPTSSDERTSDEAENSKESISSFDTIRTDPNLLKDPEALMHPRLQSRSPPEPGFKKHNNLSVTSSKLAAGSRTKKTFHLNKDGHHRSGRRSPDFAPDGSVGVSTATGSFRFLMEEESSDNDGSRSTRSSRASAITGNVDKDQSEIQWSSNTDRLI